MSIRALVLPAALFGVLGSGCGTGQAPAWHQESGYRWRELSVSGGAAGFTSMGGSTTGIEFRNAVSDSVLLYNRILAQGAGVALGDVDGDGLTDVFLARTEGANALYRNRGGWRFEDITTEAGVAAADRFSSGAALADTDGDGDLDLLLLATTGPDALFLNDGRGRFTEHGADLGLSTAGHGATTPTLADVDGDGDLDLYVANYKPFSPADSIAPQQRAFNQVVREVRPGAFEVRPEFQRDFRIVMRPDMGGLNLTMRADPDDFYRNERGRFRREPLTSGRFTDAAGHPLAEEDESFGLDARFADFNGDGAPELYVANDFEDPDRFFINDGKGGFRLAPWSAQRQMSNSGMGLDVGDVNGDGLPDLFVVDMLSRDTRRLKTEMPTHTSLPKTPGDQETQLQFQRNTLFLNRGDGTFGEAAAFAGIAASGWSWSTLFMDVDLDGWQDILIATGHPWDVMDADTQERLQNRLNDVAWQRQRWEYPTLRLPNLAFRNRGDLTFEDKSTDWNFGTEADISHAMAAGDLDGDGDLDLVVNRLGSPALVLRNNAPAARVAVRLHGAAPNTNAVGAAVRLLGGATPIQEREISAGGQYLSHSDYLASFAAGASDSMRLEVRWRDGRRTIIAPVRANRLYEISDSGAVPGTPDVPLPAPLFADATSELGGHVHVEDRFDDWDRQFLLPNALSQLGPGVSWFDLDRDGDEDLIVGSGKGGSLGVFLNQGGRLVSAPGRGAPAAADLTTVLGLASNAGSRILAGMSTWQARELAERIAQPAAVSFPAGRSGVAGPPATLIGSTESAVGPMALSDYDGDGDLDLFVGGRAIPMRYPVAASSGLFRNEAGRFVHDSANSAPLKGIGQVSAALFADVDGDGDDDLLLAREWESILLLLNTGGRFVPAAPDWGLGRWTGRWIGIASGDLDGDGRLDLVATGWGRNTVERADSANPLVLVHGEIGARQEEEMLLVRNDPRIGAPAPLNSYARVRVAIPSVVGRARTFAAYADGSLEQLLGPLAAQVDRLPVRTLDHMAFLNRGHRFEGVPLPTEAQLAPASYAGIADFDGNGTEDVFLSQNFFPTSVGTPRYDMGRSLLLSGDGKGGLAAVAGQRSGLIVYGDQRGAAYGDADGDGRLDLVVSENGGATRFFRNRGATPGLRVRLTGPGGNPDAIGAQLRLVYGATMGPVREIQAGSGYWSQNGAVQVMGMSGTPDAVWIRWPGGREARVPIPSGAREVRASY